MTKTTIIRERLVDHYVTITDGMIVEDSEFDGCIINFPAGTRYVRMTNNVFRECMFIGDGWPKPIMSVDLR
jgi:hypothetical protein